MTKTKTIEAADLVTVERKTAVRWATLAALGSEVASGLTEEEMAVYESEAIAEVHEASAKAEGA